MTHVSLTGESRAAGQLVRPVVTALKRDVALRHEFAAYCVAAGADALTIGRHIAQLEEGKAPAKAFLAMQVLLFGLARGLIQPPPLQALARGGGGMRKPHSARRTRR